MSVEQSAPMILVHLDDHKWTLAAVEAACEHAREIGGGTIILARLLSANFLNWHGLEAEEYVLSDTEREELAEYEAIAQRYGVPVRHVIFKYEGTLVDGITQAADALNAQDVFANVPIGSLPLLNHREVKLLGHKLEEHHHHLYLVEPPAAPVDWHPEGEEFHD